MNVIEVENLKKYYEKGEIRAVDDISFKVEKGARFGFLGPNGAGKTTTIRCILGFLNLDGGEVSVFGNRLDPKKNVRYRNKVGYLPGELGLYKQMSAESLLKYLANLYDIDIDWNFVREISERLQLDLKRKTKVLSKGNKQKVGVLTALMGDFELLIMDEPTSGLDPLMQSEFYKIVSERQKESNITVFISSHVLPEVEKFCDKVAIIKEGKIIEIANIQELKAKSLKHIELIFESAKSLNSFKNFLENEYPEATVKYNFDIQIEFLLPPQQAREILHDLSEKEWAGAPVKDFTIRHSTLENIFLQYYQGKNKTMEVKT
jgi:ABC-2 type transport system ATP-binding protein